MRVVAMAEPGNEDGLVVPLPAHRGLPQIVEQAADTVGRALQDDFRAGGTRHRLQGAGRVLLGIGPVRDLGAVEELDGVGASDPRRLRGAHLVRSEEHTSELQSLMRIAYAVFCLTKKKHAPLLT